MNTNKHERLCVFLGAVALFSNLALGWYILGTAEMLCASEVACEQIRLIRERCAIAGLLDDSCGAERVKIINRKDGERFPAGLDAPTQISAVEDKQAAASDEPECDYCDTRDALTFSLGDLAKAHLKNGFSFMLSPSAKYLRTAHAPDNDEGCRAHRCGMHWRAAVSALCLRRDLDMCERKHQGTVNHSDGGDLSDMPPTRGDDF